MSEELKGIIVKLHCQYEKFCAGRIEPIGGGVDVSFSLKGYVCLDQVVTLLGAFEVGKYGRQFAAVSVKDTREVDADGYLAWLWMIGKRLGFGKLKAKSIVKEFGTSFGEILMADPEQIAITCQMELPTVKLLADEYVKHQAEISTFAALKEFGLTDYISNIIYEKYRDQSVAMVKENPFRLADEVPGIGFKKADEIAAKVGVIGDHPQRVRAGLLFALQDGQSDGSTCSTEAELTEQAQQLLDLPGVDLVRPIVSLADTGEITLESGLYANPWLASCERWVGERLGHFQDEPEFDLESRIRCYGGNATESQRDAIRTAMNNRISVITGPAGSGKTFILAIIVKMLQEKYIDFALCAPTGKAARRMQEVIGVEAFTIHRLLKYKPPGEWGYSMISPLPCDVVICDEISMCDSEISFRLMSALKKGAKLIMVGDHNQLPPVGPGALLRDCIRHNLVPVANLHEVHRSAGPLRDNAFKILEGKVLPTVFSDGDGKLPCWGVDDRHVTETTVMQTMDKLFSEVLETEGYDPLKKVQFLTPRRSTSLGCETLNIRFQKIHQHRLGLNIPPVGPHKRPPMYKGDKVIMTKNNYELEIMNGHTGYVLETDPLVVQFDGEENAHQIPKDAKGNIDLAYWLTVHKFQGSQIPVVVTLVWSGHLGSWQAPMLHRNLLYTSVTRGQKKSLIIGDGKGIKGAADRTVENSRRTLLPIYSMSQSVKNGHS